MPPSPEASTDSYVVLHTGAVPCALPANRVKRIVFESEWTGATPFELFAGSAAEPSLPSMRRVLVVHNGSELVPVLSTRQVEVAQVPEGAIVPVPDLVLSPSLRHLVAGVFLGGQTAGPLLVLAPEALGRTAPST
jgi:hypothetical protein